jgi:hypothetical protein
MTAFLGGTVITELAWTGLNALQVSFAVSTAWADKRFQVYVGKRLAGTTLTADQRSLIVDVPYTSRAIPLSLVVVDPADSSTDFSSLFEWKPWNIYCISFTAPDPLPADIDRYEVVMSTEAGGAYDTSNVVRVIPHTAGRTIYSVELPDIASSGDWEVAVIPRDNAKPSGNAGTAAETTIPAVVYPADLTLDTSGRRFTATVESGTLTATFTCP